MDSSAGTMMMMRMRMSTTLTQEITITKDKMEFKLAEKVGKHRGR